MNRFMMAGFCSLCAMVGLQAAAGSNSDVTVTNYSGWVIMELYMSPSDSDEWGPDQLEAEVLGSGDSLTLVKVPCDDWDIMIVDQDEDVCILEEVDLCADSATWDITDAELLTCIADTE